MTIQEILTAVHAFKKRTGRHPKSSFGPMHKAIKEGQRKIGSWRKILWIASAIEDERNAALPQLGFVRKGNRYEPDDRSLRILELLDHYDRLRKEKVV